MPMSDVEGKKNVMRRQGTCLSHLLLLHKNLAVLDTQATVLHPMLCIQMLAEIFHVDCLKDCFATAPARSKAKRKKDKM